jgi:TRAP-type C4-dicarboxylate transport system substrate-binding protein
MTFLSKQWYDALPKDLQTIIDTDAAKASDEIDEWEVGNFAKARQAWAEHGELINLPSDEQAQMMQTLAAVSAEVAKRKPKLEEAYNVFAAVAQRTK